VPARRASKSERREPRWARWSDERLLRLRLCDLGVDLRGRFVQKNIRELLTELEERGLGFQPHFWVSTEWFSPAGIPGVAIPFYLCHPRLALLEKRQMLDVEGGSRRSCLRILRHEAGHALDTAFRLSRRRRWRELFGSPSRRYPEEYSPRAYSKRYVLHLDYWYAQSHPSEDFAETFAVWLSPGSRWPSRYQGWPALKKLEYVDELMREIAGKKPLVKTRQLHEPVAELEQTLGEHYDEKRARYETDHPEVYDQALRRLVTDSSRARSRQAASAFLRRNRVELRQRVAEWTGEYTYTIDLVLAEMIKRCRELELRLHQSESETKVDAALLLTAQTMQYLSGRHTRVAL
jgi:hypothetical protein